MYFRPECGREGRMGNVYGPYEFLQITYTNLRISPDGDFAMTFETDGDWHFDAEFPATEADRSLAWSDIVLWAAKAGE